MAKEEFKKAKIILGDLNAIDWKLERMKIGEKLVIAFDLGGVIDGYPINREDVLQFLKSRKESIEKELEALNP